MRTPTILAAGILCAAMMPATVALADVSIDATIRTADPLGWSGANRIAIHTSNDKVGVCGLTGTVQVFQPGRIWPSCVYNIKRSSVLEAGSSPIGLHDNAGDCLGEANTANPLVVVDLVADPGVTITFNPRNGEGEGRGCRALGYASYTFCTEDNTSKPCFKVRNFRLNINAQ